MIGSSVYIYHSEVSTIDGVCVCVCMCRGWVEYIILCM